MNIIYIMDNVEWEVEFNSIFYIKGGKKHERI